MHRTDGNEIKRKLESRDINDIIAGFHDLSDIASMLFTQSVGALKANPEWRIFIAERISEIIKHIIHILEDSFEREVADEDMRFWLSIFLMDYSKLEYSSDMFSHVQTHEDEKEILGLNYLTKKNIPGVGDVILNKLRKIKFETQNFNRISFYLDKLTLLKIAVSADINQRIIEYNKKVEHEWEKLVC